MFKIESQDELTKARTGSLKTRHGTIQTPAFLPVATKGVVKTLDASDLEDLGVSALIVNAFHLWLRGLDAVEGVGGLHEFMNWNGPIFTDSGGFQIIRKDFDFKITDEGFTLTFPMDGQKVTYSPEICMNVHSGLGSDIAFVLDDCPPYPSDKKRLEESVQRTLDWARRCKDVKAEGQMLFGIPQGGTNSNLRKQSAKELADVGFDGYGIGGLSIGEPTEEMISALNASMSAIPSDSPKHMMGVGSPGEILESVSLGVDIFDSAYPTRNARHGTFYTSQGRHDIRKSKYMRIKDPLEEDCSCSTCRDYSTSYIHHLFKEREMLAYRLLSIHNLSNVLAFFTRIREATEEGRFSGFKKEFLSGHTS